MARFQLLSLVAVLFWACPGLLFAEEAENFGAPNPGVPELKELVRFQGEWEAQLGNSDQKIPSKRKWMFDGHFLKHEFEVSGGALRGTIFRGYDQKNQRYTMTFLDSQGNASLLAGSWDQELKNFTFDAVDSSCPIQKYESYFPDEKTEQWTITFDNTQQSQVSGIAKKLSD